MSKSSHDNYCKTTEIYKQNLSLFPIGYSIN
jgi:hypothetical protein